MSLKVDNFDEAVELAKKAQLAAKPSAPELAQSDDIEIKRGYEVLQNNDIRFGI